MRKRTLTEFERRTLKNIRSRIRYWENKANLAKTHREFVPANTRLIDLYQIFIDFCEERGIA